MADVKRLDKSAILNGSAQVHYEHVEELGGELALVPLTEGQWAQVSVIKSSGIKMVGNPKFDADGRPDFADVSSNFTMEMDLKKINECDFEADVLAVSYSLSGGTGETWTVEDVKKIRPAGIVPRIAKVVYEITGVTPAQIQEVQNFRGKPGGTKSRRPSSDGSAAGAEAK